MIKKSIFRIDLYFRINVLQIQAPSLRQIPEDIPIIAKHLMSLLKEEIGWGPSGISDDAMNALKRYSWPGNVRELRNALERAMIVSKDHVIDLEDLPASVRSHDDETSLPDSILPGETLRRILDDTEKRPSWQLLTIRKGISLRRRKFLAFKDRHCMKN
jgi:DNA-binding NtrC family response regulator